MARPSVKDERTEAILAAFERCVARHGVEGATLQRVADEAGLARGLLRHHVGNREEMIAALAERFLRKNDALTAELLAELPAEGRIEALIDLLFAPEYASEAGDLRVAEALIGAAATRPALRKLLRRWFDDFEATIAGELRGAYPEAAEEDLCAVTTGLVGIYFSVDSLTPLGPLPELFERSRRAALRLVGTLSPPPK